MAIDYQASFTIPGQRAVLETSENQFWWGRWENQIWEHGIVLATTTDEGNTSYPTILRPGLLLGKITATGKLTDWAPAAVDGSEQLFGILGHSINMGLSGTTADRYLAWVMVGGQVKPNKLIVPGTTALSIVGNAQEYTIRNQMAGRYILDDNVLGQKGRGYPIQHSWLVYEGNTDGAATITAADDGALFVMDQGRDMAVTLPAPKRGMIFDFLLITDYELSITAATADTLIAYNDATASSVTITTALHQVGAYIRLIGVNATSFAAINLGGHTQTVA